jgi:hypothetical protein
MRIFRTRLIVPLAASLMLSAASALAAESYGGGIHAAMAAPHTGGRFGGGQHLGGTQHFGGAEHFAPHGQAFANHLFHGHDFGHFTPEERGHWTGGSWQHGWHDGRLSWWWIVDGDWYFYPEPIYPYPNYIVPDGVSGGYYCTNPLGYYPYVASCDVPWQFVPAVAPPP